MSIYEYRCKKCGHVTSFLEGLGRKEAHKCEKCGSRDTEKILSTFAAQTKGSSSGSSSCPTGTCPLS